jgi:hypothetical protein
MRDRERSLGRVAADHRALLSAVRAAMQRFAKADRGHERPSAQAPPDDLPSSAEGSLLRSSRPQGPHARRRWELQR